MVETEASLPEIKRNVDALWTKHDKLDEKVDSLGKCVSGIEAKLDWSGRLLIWILYGVSALVTGGGVAFIAYLLTAVGAKS